jgi:hypothetical protein
LGLRRLSITKQCSLLGSVLLIISAAGSVAFVTKRAAGLCRRDCQYPHAPKKKHLPDTVEHVGRLQCGGTDENKSMDAHRPQRLVLGRRSLFRDRFAPTEIGSSGAAGQPETHRMVDEKIQAGLDIQRLALSGALGLTPHGAVAKTLSHYRRKVRANGRRLSQI